MSGSEARAVFEERRPASERPLGLIVAGPVLLAAAAGAVLKARELAPVARDFAPLAAMFGTGFAVIILIMLRRRRRRRPVVEPGRIELDRTGLHAFWSRKSATLAWSSSETALTIIEAPADWCGERPQFEALPVLTVANGELLVRVRSDRFPLREIVRLAERGLRARVESLDARLRAGQTLSWKGPFRRATLTDRSIAVGDAQLEWRSVQAVTAEHSTLALSGAGKRVELPLIELEDSLTLAELVRLRLSALPQAAAFFETLWLAGL